MTVILFLVVLFVLILVHEWGHFIAAKKTGMRVDEFGIGFPPKLFSWKKGETEYSLNLFPIGGFVRILGENAADVAPAVSEGEVSAGAATDRAQPGDYERSFIAKPKWAQAVVLVAGVTMNIILAWFLFAAVFMLGVPTAVEESEASPAAQLVVAGVLPDSPAAAAGITPGTEIVGVTRGDESLTEFVPSTFSDFTQASEASITLTIKHGDEEINIDVAPQSGVISDEESRPAIGVQLAIVEEVSLPIHEALMKATVTTGQSLVAITVGIFTLISQSIQGTADFSQVAGPIGIVGLVGDAASFGLTSLFMLTAIISLNLAIINMLPFPALDGGRLLFVAIEAVTRKPIKPVWVARLNTVGFVLLILLMVAVTYNDILRIL